MATLIRGLRRHPTAARQSVRTEAPARVRSSPAAPPKQERIDVARLEQIEEQFLADAIEHHPRRDVALDRLAADVEQADGRSVLAAEMESARRSPLLLRSTASLNRMEELLLEAVVRTHPNRDRALDRLLDDVASDGEIAEWAPTDLPEDFVDNDFDGMA